MANNKLIIDAETWLYRCAAAAEHEVEWFRDVWTYTCNIGCAKDAFALEMERIQQVCPDHEMTIVLGSGTNFRYAVYTGYKANRRKLRRPAGYQALRQWVAECWAVQTLDHVEADDVCGIIYEPGDVICSRDKDLMTLPGLHLTGEKDVVEVSEAEADFNFHVQTLTGDSTDGYPGLKGVGPVAAKKALSGAVDATEMWDAVLRTYTSKGHGYDYALQMARCARILRAGEYDYNAGRPILWNPPTRCQNKQPLPEWV